MLVVFGGIWPALAYGDAMSSFTRDGPRDDLDKVFQFLFLAVPMVSVWVKSRIALVIGYISVCLLLLFALVATLIYPAGGLIAILAAIVWLVCATEVWQSMKAKE